MQQMEAAADGSGNAEVPAVPHFVNCTAELGFRLAELLGHFCESPSPTNVGQRPGYFLNLPFRPRPAPAKARQAMPSHRPTAGANLDGQALRRRSIGLDSSISQRALAALADVARGFFGGLGQRPGPPAFEDALDRFLQALGIEAACRKYRGAKSDELAAGRHRRPRIQKFGAATANQIRRNSLTTFAGRPFLLHRSSSPQAFTGRFIRSTRWASNSGPCFRVPARLR